MWKTWDVIKGPQSPQREEVGVDGRVNKMSDFNTGACCSSSIYTISGLRRFIRDEHEDVMISLENVWSQVL